MLQVRRIRAQAMNAPGFAGIELRRTEGLAFWTKTLWQDKPSLIAFSSNDAHQAGKPKLEIWCDEAVHAHWVYESEDLPTWSEAERALVEYGRLSQLRHPSSEQQNGKINTA